MVTPSSRRDAAEHLVAKKKYTIRMACKTMSLKRATYYYKPKANPFERRLLKRIYAFREENPRYGYRRMTVLLKREGWKVNRKRIQRLYRVEGLKVSKKQHKRRRQGKSTTVRQRALYPNHVWSWDFLFDRTEDGRAVKILNIVDEYSRFNIALECKRSYTGKEVMDTVYRSMLRYGIPACIRSDNGPEFICKEVRKRLDQCGIHIRYIDPGSPWQNGYVESLNDKIRDEKLNQELLTSILEAQFILDEFRDKYNMKRPHSSLDDQTPATVFDQFIKGGSQRDHVYHFLPNGQEYCNRSVNPPVF